MENKCTNSTGELKANLDKHLGVKKEVYENSLTEDGETAEFLETESTDEDNEAVEFLETEFTDGIWGSCC